MTYGRRCHSYTRNEIWGQAGREKAVAPHSSTLAWKIPWTEDPGGLPSMGSHYAVYGFHSPLSLSSRVTHD